MPNWTYNLLVVEGEPDRVADFVESVRGVAGDGEPLELDFERHVPTPPEVLVSDRWYAWRRQHWGTKWNASDVVRDGSPEAGCVRYRFATAWRPPDAWLCAVSAAHPDLDLRHEYVEELGHFAGRDHLRAGELVVHEEIDPATSGWWTDAAPSG